MSCLEVLPRNRKRSLWKMVRSLFFGSKTVSKVTNLRKKAIVKRRSTFDRPSSSYVYPVVQKRVSARESVSSSDEDTPRFPSDDVMPQEWSISTPNNDNNISDTTDGGSRVGHVITLAHIEIGPTLDDEETSEDIQSPNLDSNEESEQFYECHNNTAVELSSAPVSNSQEEEITRSDNISTDEILQLFEETVRIEKLNSSRSINNLSGNQSNSQSSQEINENLNEIHNLSENPSVSTPRRRIQARSNSMAVGENIGQDTTVVELERRKSYIEVSRIPPITLSYIPSGLQIDDRVVWVTENGPENGTVRWIGKIREEFYAGVELDKPIGNSSGIFGYGPGLFKRLFTCKLSFGRFIPVKELVLHSDYHDNGLKAGIICIICRDDFLESWEPTAELASGNDPSKMVATKDCGHLFHAGCLSEWFSKKNYDHQPCPYCQHPMNRNDVIRIFPAQF